MVPKRFRLTDSSITRRVKHIPRSNLMEFHEIGRRALIGGNTCHHHEAIAGLNQSAAQ
jgi:hypothetical protein